MSDWRSSVLGVLGGRPLPDRPRDPLALAMVRLLVASTAFTAMVLTLALLFDQLVASSDEVIWPFDRLAGHVEGAIHAAVWALGAASPTALGVVQTWPFVLLCLAYIGASTFFDPRPRFAVGVPVGAMGIDDGPRNLYVLQLLLSVLGVPGRFVGYAAVEVVRSLFPEEPSSLADPIPPAPDDRRPLDREKSAAWRRKVETLDAAPKRRRR